MSSATQLTCLSKTVAFLIHCILITFCYKVENLQMTLFELGVVVLDLFHQTFSFTLILLSEFFLRFKFGNVSLNARKTSTQDASAPSCTCYIVRHDFFNKPTRTKPSNDQSKQLTLYKPGGIWFEGPNEDATVRMFDD